MKSPLSFQLTSLALRNIRRFDELTIDLSRRGKSGPAPRPATVLIGRNGTCKSTLLRCLTIGLAPLPLANSLLRQVPGLLVGNRGKEGQIVVGLVDRASNRRSEITTKITIPRGGRPEVAVREGFDSPPLLGDGAYLYGYGPTRGSIGATDSDYSAISATTTLFSSTGTLIDPELALRRLQDHLGSEIFERTLKGIRRTIGLAANETIEIKKGGGVFVAAPQFGPLPLGALADGHRVPLGMIFDLFHWAMQSGQVTAGGGIRGILLVDEIEQHLHPALQADAIPRLRRLLPELQIIASTHSPLVALSVEPEELVVLRKRGEHVQHVANVPDFRAFTADDMLAHERLFDAPIQAPEVQVKTQRYQQLIGAKRRTKAQNRELAGLAAEMSAKSPDDDDPQLDALLSKLRTKFGV